MPCLFPLLCPKSSRAPVLQNKPICTTCQKATIIKYCESQAVRKSRPRWKNTHQKKIFCIYIYLQKWPTRCSDSSEPGNLFTLATPPTGFKRPSEIAQSSESNNFYLPIRFVTLCQVWNLQIFRHPRNTIPSFKSSQSPPNKKNTTQLTDRYDLRT